MHLSPVFHRQLFRRATEVDLKAAGDVPLSCFQLQSLLDVLRFSLGADVDDATLVGAFSRSP